MAKVFNVDSTLENADWIKRGTLDIGKINSIDDVLKFLNISSPASELPKETIENIMTYNWYQSLPTSIRKDFSVVLDEAETKEQNETL